MDDPIEQLIWKTNHQCVFGVLGSPSTKEHVLVELDGNPLDQAVLDEARERQFIFAGVWGMNGEVVDYAAQPGAEAAAVMLASSATFRKYLYRTYGPAQKSAGDSLDWLKRLAALPDPRKGMN